MLNKGSVEYKNNYTASVLRKRSDNRIASSKVAANVMFNNLSIVCVDDLRSKLGNLISAQWMLAQGDVVQHGSGLQ